jgi:hypothetical protein
VVNRRSKNGMSCSHISFTVTWRGPRFNHSELQSATWRVQALPGDPNRLC